MIVFDLTCHAGHRFEGWFGSSDEFADQIAEDLIACPQCGSVAVSKAPMAPAVGTKANRQAPGLISRDSVSGATVSSKVAKAIRALAKAQAKALEKSKYVGEKFADESRAMHYGEKKAAIIHGKASEDERRELLDEGITVAPLLAPFVPPEDIN